ncbi:hypothetical protein RB653_002026 [Dictyostelium firmibasis]|uniref:Uncharacterized protein n=1 Tax=Dictyostelium firmibasis TaxID=79012 RepID=A0AAN7TX15_9MYCE
MKILVSLIFIFSLLSIGYCNGDLKKNNENELNSKRELVVKERDEFNKDIESLYNTFKKFILETPIDNYLDKIENIIEEANEIEKEQAIRYQQIENQEFLEESKQQQQQQQQNNDNKKMIKQKKGGQSLNKDDSIEVSPSTTLEDLLFDTLGFNSDKMQKLLISLSLGTGNRPSSNQRQQQQQQQQQRQQPQLEQQQNDEQLIVPTLTPEQMSRQHPTLQQLQEQQARLQELQEVQLLRQQQQQQQQPLSPKEIRQQDESQLQNQQWFQEQLLIQQQEIKRQQEELKRQQEIEHQRRLELELELEKIKKEQVERDQRDKREKQEREEKEQREKQEREEKERKEKEEKERKEREQKEKEEKDKLKQHTSPAFSSNDLNNVASDGGQIGSIITHVREPSSEGISDSLAEEILDFFNHLIHDRKPRNQPKDDSFENTPNTEDTSNPELIPILNKKKITQKI